MEKRIQKDGEVRPNTRKQTSPMTKEDTNLLPQLTSEIVVFTGRRIQGLIRTRLEVGHTKP